MEAWNGFGVAQATSRPMAEPSPYMTELLRNPQDWMHQEGRGSVARFRHIEYFLGNKEIIVGVISETFFFFFLFYVSKGNMTLLLLRRERHLNQTLNHLVMDSTNKDEALQVVSC